MKKTFLFIAVICSLSAKSQQVAKQDTALVFYLPGAAVNALNDIISKTEAPYTEVNALLALLQYQASLQNKKVKPATIDSADKKNIVKTD